MGVLAFTACGYRSALSVADSDSAAPFVVVSERVQVPHAAALAALEAGARSELAGAGDRAACSAGSRKCSELVVELSRVDETSEGIGAVPAPVVAPSTLAKSPLGRGTRLTVTGRAFVRRFDGATSRNTGDVSVSEVVGRIDNAQMSPLARDQALRIAARRLGARLVRRILGWPEPAHE